MGRKVKSQKLPKSRKGKRVRGVKLNTGNTEKKKRSRRGKRAEETAT